jgi:viologen exporter family transport system permease protein
MSNIEVEAINRSPFYRARRMLNLSLQKYAAIMRVGIANNLAYVMEVVFRALLLVVLVFVLGQLWTTTYTSRGVSR